MVCKSCVSVNHLHLHIQIFYTYTYLVAVYIFVLHLHGASVNLSNRLTPPRVNILGGVSVNTKIICKVILSLGLLSPQTLLSGVSIK